jgi:DNA repair protein RadC
MSTTTTPIKSWPKEDQPRQKLLQRRPSALTNTELVAILLGTGSGHKTAVDLAQDILSRCHDNLNELGKWTAKDFMRIDGIGPAKATVLCSALELSRRRQSETALERYFIRSSKEAADYLKPLISDYSHEVFGALFLAQAGWIRRYEIIHEGGITSTTVDPRVIFKKAVDMEAVSLIVFHNHPSGKLRPSKADEALTQKLNSCSKIMDIKLLDHVIFSEKGYFSFADEGLLP